jgi:hypothetical protein
MNDLVSQAARIYVVWKPHEPRVAQISGVHDILTSPSGFFVHGRPRRDRSMDAEIVPVHRRDQAAVHPARYHVGQKQTFGP